MPLFIGKYVATTTPVVSAACNSPDQMQYGDTSKLGHAENGLHDKADKVYRAAAHRSKL